MRKICAALFLLLTATIFAQTSVFSKKYQMSSDYFRAQSIVPAFDKGLLCAGQTNFGSKKGVVMKTDSLGNVAWSKMYTFGTGILFLKGICRTSDSCYAVAGTLGSNVLCMKLKKNGDTVWVKNIVSAGNVNSIQQTKDKGYILTSSDGLAVVTKIDSLGNFQWKQRINSANQQNYGITTKQLADSSYAVLVYRETNISSVFMGHTTLIHLTKTGNLDWAKSYNKATQLFNWGLDMEVVEDGIIVFMNVYANDPIGLLKTDLAGNFVWCKTYPGIGINTLPDFRKLLRTKDKGFVFGTDRAIKTDSIGIPIWINTFNNPQPHIPYDLAETKDKKIASVSYYYGSSFTDEVHVITMDSLGNSAACTQSVPTSVWFEGWVATAITPTLISGGSVAPITATIAAITVSSSSGCPPVYPWSVNEQGENRISLEISPNPSEGMFNLKIKENIKVQYFISDVTGRQIVKGNCERETLIDISNEASGVYLLHIIDSKGHTLDTRKLIKK